MPKRIRPDVNEISLAFNPANMKKFLMHKDDDKKNLKKGEETMEKLIKILKDKGLLSDEKAFANALKKANVTELAIAEDFEKVFEVVVDLMPKVDEKEIRKDLEAKIRKTLESELRKTLEPEIRKALEKELGKAENETIKLLKDEVKQLGDDLKAARKEVETERDARRLSEIKESVKDMGVPGDLEKISKTILMTEKINPELAKDITETLKETGEAFKTSGAFLELGSSRGGEELGKAYDELIKLRNAAMEKDSNLTEQAAMRKVCRENPKLYQEYTKEHQMKGGMH